MSSEQARATFSREAKQAHQDQVCHAVITVIESRRGGRRNYLSRPEALDRKRPAVEFECMIRGQRYVLEHTLIETFPNQIATENRVKKLLAPLTESLSGHLPSPGDYSLELHFKALEGAHNFETIRRFLKPWILEQAPRLEYSESNKILPTSIAQAGPPDIPFQVILRREFGLGGRLDMSLRLPNRSELEELRYKRLGTALADKTSKLLVARKDDGCSVLILEWNDLQLANIVSISLALQRQLAGRQEVPDEIYLVDTTIPNSDLLIWIFKDHAGSFLNLIHDKPYRFDPVSSVVKSWRE